MSRAEPLRPTFASVSLDNIRSNYRAVKKKIGPSSGILPIIKADAYGHGMLRTATALSESGCRLFGVATLDEAVRLREKMRSAEILLLGSIYPFANLATAFEHRIIPTIGSLDGLSWYNSFLKRKNSRAAVHLKIDSGMNRIGFAAQHIRSKLQGFARMKNLVYEGVYTHFAAADSDREYTSRQLDLFNNAVDALSSAGIRFKFVHAANSAALLSYPRARFNLVRPGLLLYGLLPFDRACRMIDVKPAMSVKSRIVFLKWVRKNSKISYGGTFTAPYDMYVATIPIGYADGYSRALSNLGYVLIDGKKCFVAGRVCMDMIMVDVSQLKRRVRVGDEVTVLGGEMSAETMAYLCGTINYEITCGFSARVPRIYP